MEDFIELFDSSSSFVEHIAFVNNDELPERLISEHIEYQLIQTAV